MQTFEMHVCVSKPESADVKIVIYIDLDMGIESDTGRDANTRTTLGRDIHA